MQESFNTHLSDSILVLDPDINVLLSIKALLRKENLKVFLMSSESEALELLRHEKINVILSEMLLEESDGLTFFHKTIQMDKLPIRILFTSFAEQSVILDALFEGTIHHFTQKPWADENLISLINRSVKLYNDLQNTELQKILSDSAEMLRQSNPKTNLEFSHSNLEDIEIEEVVEKIENDPLVASKVLQISNSVYFGLQKPITSVIGAAQFLGVRYSISLLTLYKLAHSFLQNSDSFSKNLIEKFILLSVQRANLARKYCGKYSEHCNKNKESIFIAALLLDLGHLVKIWFEPEKYDEIFKLIESDKLSFYDAEQKIFKISHEIVGAKVLEFWNFPQSIIEIILNHHFEDNLSDEVKLIQIVDHMVSSELSGPHFKDLEEELKVISF